MRSAKHVVILLLIIGACLQSVEAFSANNRKDRSRPILASNSFALLSAIKDGIQILPAPNNKGMGAFAAVRKLSGTRLGEYFGERLTRQQVESRYWSRTKKAMNKHDRKWRNSRKRRRQGITGDYLFDMGGNVFIDGEDGDVSSWCRFANHASPHDENACNVEVCRSTNAKDEDTLYLWALRDIEVGEELCYDYGEDYWEEGA